MFLCEFIGKNVKLFNGKNVLELGSGTGICGIMAAKIGANVIMSDNNPFSLELIEKNIKLNNIKAHFMEIAWANREHLTKMFSNDIDCIIGSDLCYEETQFESLLLTVSFLMKIFQPKEIPFYLTYEFRCSHHQIQCLLNKFKLSSQLLSCNTDFKIHLYRINLCKV